MEFLMSAEHTDIKKLNEAVYTAFAKAGLPVPTKGMVDLLVGIASDVYDIGFLDGYRKGVADERTAEAPSSSELDQLSKYRPGEP